MYLKRESGAGISSGPAPGTPSSSSSGINHVDDIPLIRAYQGYISKGTPASPPKLVNPEVRCAFVHAVCEAQNAEKRLSSYQLLSKQR
jgi:hypothetical protein